VRGAEVEAPRGRVRDGVNLRVSFSESTPTAAASLYLTVFVRQGGGGRGGGVDQGCTSPTPAVIACREAVEREVDDLPGTCVDVERAGRREGDRCHAVIPPMTAHDVRRQRG